MKNNKYIKNFEDFNENLNVSDINDSKNKYTVVSLDSSD